MKSPEYFYCIKHPDGLVYIWTAKYYRGQCINSFMGTSLSLHWSHMRSQGYKCIKIKLNVE